MDNYKQINRIERYRKHLQRVLHTDIDLNYAATIWIEKYARLWREKQVRTKQHEFLTIN